LTRIYAIANPREVADPGYLERLDEAVAVALEYRLGVLEGGERQAPDVPTVLLAQARLDARDGVPLDTVLLRYFAAMRCSEISWSKRRSGPRCRARRCGRCSLRRRPMSIG
jgi:hypothetical protein